MIDKQPKEANFESSESNLMPAEIALAASKYLTSPEQGARQIAGDTKPILNDEGEIEYKKSALPTTQPDGVFNVTPLVSYEEGGATRNVSLAVYSAPSDLGNYTEVYAYEQTVASDGTKSLGHQPAKVAVVGDRVGSYTSDNSHLTNAILTSFKNMREFTQYISNDQDIEAHEETKGRLITALKKSAAVFIIPIHGEPLSEEYWMEHSGYATEDEAVAIEQRIKRNEAEKEREWQGKSKLSRFAIKTSWKLTSRFNRSSDVRDHKPFGE